MSRHWESYLGLRILLSDIATILATRMIVELAGASAISTSNIKIRKGHEEFEKLQRSFRNPQSLSPKP